MADAWVLAQVISGAVPGGGLPPASRSFFERRGLAAGAPLPPQAEFKDLFELKLYARFDGLAPDGRAVVVFLLKEGGKFERHVPDFNSLLDGLGREAAAGLAVSEVVFVGSPALFLQNRIMEVVAQRRALAAEKKGPFFYAFHYSIFVTDVPAHVYVPPHHLASPEDLAGLEFSYTSADALPRIWDNDPPAFWLGARPGDIVRIERDSLTAGVAPEFRLVVPGRLNRVMA
jgi:DNA-directed RNA polymerase subunit H